MDQVLKNQHVPRRASTIAMWLFLASLGVLFLASMLAYVLVRVLTSTPDTPRVHLPASLWVSTLMMLAASYTIERALRAIRLEKQALFRTYLAATVLFALVFVAIQTPAMTQLLREHQAAQQVERERLATQPPSAPPVADPSVRGDEVIQNQRKVPFSGLIMVLILIHALHVIGGMIALGIVAYHGHQGRYDHEHYTGVRHCVLYWHFLDGVWIVMFVVVSAFG